MWEEHQSINQSYRPRCDTSCQEDDIWAMLILNTSFNTVLRSDSVENPLGWTKTTHSREDCKCHTILVLKLILEVAAQDIVGAKLLWHQPLCDNPGGLKSRDTGTATLCPQKCCWYTMDVCSLSVTITPQKPCFGKTVKAHERSWMVLCYSQLQGSTRGWDHSNFFAWTLILNVTRRANWKLRCWMNLGWATLSWSLLWCHRSGWRLLLPDPGRRETPGRRGQEERSGHPFCCGNPETLGARQGESLYCQLCYYYFGRAVQVGTSMSMSLSSTGGVQTGAWAVHRALGISVSSLENYILNSVLYDNLVNVKTYQNWFSTKDSFLCRIWQAVSHQSFFLTHLRLGAVTHLSSVVLFATSWWQIYVHGLIAKFNKFMSTE